VTPVVGYCLSALGAVIFAVGYFRKSRNLMLFGMIALVVGFGWQDLLAGFRDGWRS
jgi:hypothetical protein